MINIWIKYQTKFCIITLDAHWLILISSLTLDHGFQKYLRFPLMLIFWLGNYPEELYDLLILLTLQFKLFTPLFISSIVFLDLASMFIVMLQFLVRLYFPLFKSFLWRNKAFCCCILILPSVILNLCECFNNNSHPWQSPHTSKSSHYSQWYFTFLIGLQPH